jgi:hypothetical protein
MTAQELLTRLRSQGITLVVSGDGLKCRGKQSVVTSEVLETLRQHKSEVLALLRPVGDGQPPPLERPPETEQELRRLIDHLGDPVAFRQWLERVLP